jgi:hypothetical protein
VSAMPRTTIFATAIMLLLSGTIGVSRQVPTSTARIQQTVSENVAGQPAQPVCDQRSIDNRQAATLLERVEEILKTRTQSKDGRIVSAGQVTLSRADLDEVLAEVQQLKIMFAK